METKNKGLCPHCVSKGKCMGAKSEETPLTKLVKNLIKNGTPHDPVPPKKEKCEIKSILPDVEEGVPPMDVEE